MKKRILKVTFVMFFISLVLFVCCGCKNINDYDDEQLVICNVSIDDEFNDNGICVVMKHKVSLEFNTYTPNDFKEIDCVYVDDITEGVAKVVKMQIEAEKTGDWSALQDRIDKNMLIDIDNYHQILALYIRDPGKENVINAIRTLERTRNDILAAEPDWIGHLGYTESNDTYYCDDSLWGLNDDYGINAPQAWSYTTGSSNVLVGVLDSGIDGTHPDLVNIINDSLHRDYVDHPGHPTYIDVNAEDLEDPNGHGTHVAGIIGAQGNNSIGVTGVNWSIRLVSLRVSDSSGHCFFINAQRAILYASENSIDILNFSIWGDTDHEGLRNAIYDYPGLFVCIAGNNDHNNDVNNHYPSNYQFSNLITVGAIKDDGSRPTFLDWEYFDDDNTIPRGSNYGAMNVDIFAPGDNIVSTVPTIVSSSGYKSYYGTSMAAPFVAGVAALMLSINPDLTPQQLKSTIMNNAVKYSTLTNLCVCGGRLDAYRAVAAVALSTTSSVDGITIDGFSSSYIPPSNMELEIPNYMACLNSSYGNYERYVVGISSNSFKNKTNIKNVVIPNTVTSIGASAFDGCTNLESVTLSSSLQTIGSSAFKGCTSLEEIEIPSSVNSIGANAFKLCASLESVTIKKEQSPITTIGLNAFMSCLNLSEIKVPDNRIADYINNVGWSGYSSLIHPENNNYTTYYLGSSPINASTYLNAGYNKLYKLVVTSSNTYYINSTSNNNITAKLYDSNYQLLNTSNGLISRYLNSGATYYLSVEYNNSSWIGTIYTNITTDSSHQHSYTYVWNSYTKHTKQCLCGDSSLKSHVVDANAFNNGQQYATCMVCGGLASVGINPRAINNYPYTLNGSFILPNGVIVLVDEDYEAYMNDTLVFINPNDIIDRNNSFITCLIRKEDNYWINTLQ